VAGHAHPHPHHTRSPTEPPAGPLQPSAPREPPAGPLLPLAPREPPAALLPPSAPPPHCSRPQARTPVTIEGLKCLANKNNDKIHQIK
jgi:hypothetical protein